MLAKELNELAERRRLLVMEADLHRSLIGLECENLRGRFTTVREAGGIAAAGSPLLMAGGALAGFLGLRYWRHLAKWVPMAWTAFRWWRSLKLP